MHNHMAVAFELTPHFLGHRGAKLSALQDSAESMLDAVRTTVWLVLALSGIVLN